MNVVSALHMLSRLETFTDIADALDTIRAAVLASRLETTDPGLYEAVGAMTQGQRRVADAMVALDVVIRVKLKSEPSEVH